MTKRILSAILASMLAVSCSAFVAGAADEEENVFYVEEGMNGDGSEEDPFGTINDAIAALNGEDGTIYIYGTYSMSPLDVPWDGMVTIAGATKDTILAVPEGWGIGFYGDITFKDVAFNLGPNSHFNPRSGNKLIMDIGDKNEFTEMLHLSVYENDTVEQAYTEINSGKYGRIDLGGAYSTSYAGGVTGDTTLVINGGEVETLRFNADHYMDTHAGISVGGNMNLIVNGGRISKGILEDGTYNPAVMGALNIIFNNGTAKDIPNEFHYFETAEGGTFIIKSDKGGMITPTADAGVFNVKADAGKVAVIDGKQVFNGTVELEAGETEVKWVDGEQPETAEPVEIKLTIGSAEIVTNGEAKALDVPAQIIDSRTMVPLRAIFEALGASVEWDDATKTVTSERGETKVSLTVGKAEITVNGAAKELDVPGQIVDSRTLVPVRAIAEAFGCDVAWDDATKTVTITE